MAGAARILAAWLTPVMGLATTALMVSGGPDGLWVALVVAVAPLIAVEIAARRPPDAAGAADPPLHGAIQVLVVGLLVWSNVALAADIAAAFMAPRWHGVVIVAGAGLVLAVWRTADRLRPALLVAALIGVSLPLLVLVRMSGVGPVRAWELLASRPAFQFSRDSPWVTEGRELSAGPRRTAVVFEEEHRLTAPSGGALRVLTRDGGRATEREWRLEAGQSVALRPGDRLEAGLDTRIRFEAGRRVPGAPASGVAWAEGRAPGWGERLGLGVTLIGGAIALFARAGLGPSSRRVVALSGAGLVAGLLLAQGWAVYGALQAPEIFLGGVTAAQLTELPTLAVGSVSGGANLQGVLLMGLLAGFLASTIALREYPGAPEPGVQGEIARDLGLWALVFGGAAVASLSAVDPWVVTLWAMGAAASSVAPAVLVAGARPSLGTAAGLLGFGGFTLLSALGRLYGPLRGTLGVALDYPALVAGPASLALLWVAKRVAPD